MAEDEEKNDGDRALAKMQSLGRKRVLFTRLAKLLGAVLFAAILIYDRIDDIITIQEALADKPPAEVNTRTIIQHKIVLLKVEKDLIKQMEKLLISAKRDVERSTPPYEQITQINSLIHELEKKASEEKDPKERAYLFGDLDKMCRKFHKAVLAYDQIVEVLEAEDIADSMNLRDSCTEKDGKGNLVPR